MTCRCGTPIVNGQCAHCDGVPPCATAPRRNPPPCAACEQLRRHCMMCGKVWDTAVQAQICERQDRTR